MQRPCSEALDVPCYGKYYMYSSGPALSRVDRPRKPKSTVKKSGPCFGNHATNIRTRGAHEFYNMMWDPSVYRGNTLKSYEKSEMERCNKKRIDMENVKRRKFPRKPKLLGGIERPRLSLEDQMDKVGFGDMGMQTEQFLQELTSDVTAKDMCTQVDTEVNARRREGARILQPFTIGVNQTCQTDLNLSFPFEKNMRPIQKELCTKIMQQSLLETTEEVEIESLRKEKRKYIHAKCEELFQLKRAVDAQRMVAEERIRATSVREQEAKMEKEAETRLSAALFSSGCIAGLWPITISILKLEGFMAETGASEIYKTLLPWMDETTRKLYKNKHMLSRKLLDEMLHTVASRREAEFASNQFWNSSSPDRRGVYSTYNFSLSEDDPHNSLAASKTTSTFFNPNYDEGLGEQ